jgi:hypothetical protein
MSSSEDSHAVTASITVTASAWVTARARVTARTKVTDTLRAGRAGMLAPTLHCQLHSPRVSLSWKS